MIDAADRLAIHELLSLYGHLIDQRRWDELDQVFVPDFVFDATDFGAPRWTSREALVESWRTDLSQHPVAHHATNVVVTEDADGIVRVMSKGIGMGRKGRVGSVTYRDVVVRTPDGWRMATRHCELRRPD